MALGRYVVVHPAGNSDIADACARCRGLLAEQVSFASMTVEELLDAGVPAARTVHRRRGLIWPGLDAPRRSGCRVVDGDPILVGTGTASRSPPPPPPRCGRPLARTSRPALAEVVDRWPTDRPCLAAAVSRRGSPWPGTGGRERIRVVAGRAGWPAVGVDPGLCCRGMIRRKPRRAG